MNPLAAVINPFIAEVGSPPIPEARGWLERYAGAFGPPIDLSQAVPGHPPHPDLLRRMAEVAGSPDGSRYGPIRGDESLRQAYAAEVARLYGARITPADVAITAEEQRPMLGLEGSKATVGVAGLQRRGGVEPFEPLECLTEQIRRGEAIGWVG